MSLRSILSVGIDVGTTTTQVVVSRLQVRDEARVGMIPQLKVESSTLVFASEPKITPLVNPTTIDVEALLAIVRDEYREAAITPSMVETGAVIITGETARTSNAQRILDGLAQQAGDFVVSVAGPNLESQIAARGSGAALWSQANYATIINIDLGGGSANAAVFTNGVHIASAASMVGGRQIRIDANHIVTYIAPPGQAIIEHWGLDIRVGAVPTLGALTAFCDHMAQAIVDLMEGTPHILGDAIELTPVLHLERPPRAVFLSGGVGKLYYDNVPVTSLADVAQFGDVGPLLAQSLRTHPTLQTMHVLAPKQTLRATVMGAASQQISLSGSTIWTEGNILPLQNLPVIEPTFADLTNPQQVCADLQGAIARWDSGTGEDEGILVALVIPLVRGTRWAQLEQIALGITQFASATLANTDPLVLLLEQDYAKVLGQTLRGMGVTQPLIVIDQVGLGEGDWIDIGEPMYDGRVVPVSVKTLVFYREQDA